MSVLAHRTYLPADRRRQQILDCALEVFARRGFHAATVGDICARARIARPTLYQYFRDKRDVLVALAASRNHAWCPAQPGTGAGAHRGPLRRGARGRLRKRGHGTAHPAGDPRERRAGRRDAAPDRRAADCAHRGRSRGGARGRGHPALRSGARGALHPRRDREGRARRPRSRPPPRCRRHRASDRVTGGARTLSPRPGGHMTRIVSSLALVLLGFALSARGVLAGGTCGDPAALSAVRALVAEQCDCAHAVSPRVYMRCVAAVVKTAVSGGTLPASCASSVLRCAAKSTCGRPGAVTCCRTTANGKAKCSIKPSAATCRAPRGGSACVGLVASFCDVCDAIVGCTVPSTTTTSTTTTTTPPPVCGDGVCNGTEQCDGTDFCGATCPGGSAAGGFLVCRPDCTIDASHCGGVSTTTVPVSTTTTTTTTSSTSTTIPNLCT